MKKYKEALLAVVFVLAAAALLNVCAGAMRPVRTGYGSLWKPYLDEPEDSLDYLYLGSSYAYCDVNPALVYDSSGLTGHVLAGPEQTLSITYWYLKQALKTQSPKVVVIESAMLSAGRYQNYSQVNIDYMPLSLNRLCAAFQAAEPDLRTGLVFSLYFYHGRWKEPFLDGAEPDPLPEWFSWAKGHTPAQGADPNMASGPFPREFQEESVYLDNLADLGAILALCRRAGAQPVVVLHPTYSQFSPDVRERIRADVKALDSQALFFDWTDETASIGLDPALHFFDAGHLNMAGAGIFSRWLGRFMTDELGASPQAQTDENTAAWRSAAEYWQNLIQSDA